ncbi:MAG TPA: SRPBCC family protein [Gemmatimonadaceae bacterium]|nr:SRPBCC family protein [Gemmatimonadaceae bacterium]
MRSTRVQHHVLAPREVVYRLLLDPAAIAHWKVPDGMTAEVHTFEPVEGGGIHISLTYAEPNAAGKSTTHTDTYRGRFIELVPNERIVEVDWFETDNPAMRGEMTSTITLTDAPSGGTDVVGVHDGVPPGVTLADNETGWRMSLAKLAKLAQAGHPTFKVPQASL